MLPFTLFTKEGRGYKEIPSTPFFSCHQSKANSFASVYLLQFLLQQESFSLRKTSFQMSSGIFPSGSLKDFVSDTSLFFCPEITFLYNLTLFVKQILSSLFHHCATQFSYLPLLCSLHKIQKENPASNSLSFFHFLKANTSFILSLTANVTHYVLKAPVSSCLRRPLNQLILANSLSFKNTILVISATLPLSRSFFSLMVYVRSNTHNYFFLTKICSLLKETQKSNWRKTY